MEIDAIRSHVGLSCVTSSKRDTNTGLTLPPYSLSQITPQPTENEARLLYLGNFMAEGRFRNCLLVCLCQLPELDEYTRMEIQTHVPLLIP